MPKAPEGQSMHTEEVFADLPLICKQWTDEQQKYRSEDWMKILMHCLR